MWPIKITIWNCNMLQHATSGKKHFLYATISVNVHMPFLLILLVALLIRDLKMSPLISPTICHIDWHLSPWPTNRQQTSFHQAIPSSILVQFASEGCVRLIRFNRVSPETESGICQRVASPGDGYGEEHHKARQHSFSNVPICSHCIVQDSGLF